MGERPFGAVKEQCAGLYAQTMAERGFLTLAFDPSFTGESGGNVRYMASPDINTEDFMAAVDFLSLNDKVDPERIGVLGICGWGGMAINTAALDTRIKATVASTMYDMTRVNANGYFDSEDSEESRYEKKKAMCAQRLEDLKNGEYKLGGGGHTSELLGDDTIVSIAEAHGVSSAQVILRWDLQRGIVVIPGSSNPDHIRENLDLFGFELTDEEMDSISQLDRNEKHDWY